MARGVCGRTGLATSKFPSLRYVTSKPVPGIATIISRSCTTSTVRPAGSDMTDAPTQTLNYAVYYFFWPGRNVISLSSAVTSLWPPRMVLIRHPTRDALRQKNGGFYDC
jgi:hypothetical protein